MSSMNNCKGDAARLKGRTSTAYRAVEAYGECVMRHWAATPPDYDMRKGFDIVAEREARHARLLAEHIVALGVAPGRAA